MKGISNGLFNNLDCTFNSTFKNLFQKGLKTSKHPPVKRVAFG